MVRLRQCLMLLLMTTMLCGVRSTLTSSWLPPRRDTTRFLTSAAFLPRRHRQSSSSSVTVCSPLPTRWLSGGATSDKNKTDLLEPDSATVGLPFREYGYRSKPFSWEELHQIIVVEQELARLSRSVEAERRYKMEREVLLEQYESIYDHILHTKFQFEKRLDEESGLWKAVPPAVANSTTSLVKNAYPYFTESEIEHWVLWKLYSEISKEDVDQAIEELQSRYGGDIVDTIWWENPPALKSLPDINHVHILVKRET